MTDEPDETLRPIPAGKVWVGPISGDDPWREIGTADEESLRRAFTGGTAFSGLPRRVHPSRALFEVSVTVAPCLTCRAPIVIINREMQRPVRIWEADDGGIMVTAHRADCTAIEHQAPEGLLLR